MKKIPYHGYICLECYERDPWFMPRAHVCEIKHNYILERTKRSFLDELSAILQLTLLFR